MLSLNPKDWAREAVIDENGKPKENVQKAIEKAIDIQRPFVIKQVRALRAKHPNDSPEEFLKRLDDTYLKVVTAGGAAVGMTAFVPGIGTAAGLGLSAAATVAFLEASAVYAQAVAEIHGVQMKDPERAKALVMAIMLGEQSSEMLKMLGQKPGMNQTDAWGKLIGSSSSQAGLSNQIMNTIKKRFITRMVTRQGAGFLGRAIPFGLGAVVGGAGNMVLGKAVIRSAHDAFGEIPAVIPAELVAAPEAPVAE